ncbi:MAG: GNAT family N-acetyltransferase [Candidatus Vogelbacteria bacterium]
MNDSSISIEPLKWRQIMKFLVLRQKIESETDHLALDGADRKSESALFAIGRMFANRKWLAILVAKDGNELIGYISIFFARFRKMKANAYLVLSVRLNHRGQGIGTKLMLEAERVAKGRGIRRLELEVFAKNIRAHKLFKRLGYEEEGRKRQVAQIQDSFDDLILMAKFL